MSVRLEQRIQGELEQFIQQGTYKRLNFIEHSKQPARVWWEPQHL
jgi:hypothetical protein